MDADCHSRVMNLDEVSEYLKMDTVTVYRLLKRGKLPAFKIGKGWRFNLDSIESWRVHNEWFSRPR